MIAAMELTVGVDGLAIRRSCAQGQRQEDVLEHKELEDDCVFTAGSTVKVPNLIPAWRRQGLHGGERRRGTGQGSSGDQRHAP